MVIVPQKMEDCKPFAPVLYLNTIFLALLTKCASFFWIILKAKKSTRACECFLVPVVGVEPTRYRYHWILSPARLPIPSYRHMTNGIIPYSKSKIKRFFKIHKIFFTQTSFSNKNTPAFLTGVLFFAFYD